MAKRGKDVSEELQAPPIPEGYDELLRAFWQLRDRAGGNGFSRNPIAHGVVCDWQSLYRVQLLPHEVDILFELDHAALAAYAEQEKPE